MEQLQKFLSANPLVPAALACAGFALAVTFHPAWLACSLAAILIPVAAGKRRIAIVAIIAGLTVWGHALWQDQLYYRETANHRATSGKAVTLEGSVVKTYTSTVWISIPGSLVLAEIVPPMGTAPVLGERWKFHALYKELPEQEFKGQFDRKAWLHRKQVAGRYQALEGSLVGKGSWQSRLHACSQICRKQIADILHRNVPEDGDIRADILSSLILGDKSYMEHDLYDLFRQSGSLHIFAVSGLHIGITAMMILFLLEWCGIHPVTARLYALPLTAAYVFVTGMPVSAVRALVMVAFLFLATALRRKYRAFNILALAVILFLAVDPRQVSDPGFQLSFAIFAVIVSGASWQGKRPPFSEPDPYIPRRIYNWRERLGVRLERSVRSAAVLSILCWLASIPLTIINFGTINLYSAFTNLMMVPLIPVTMALTMASVLLAGIPPLFSITCAISRNFASILMKIAQSTAALPSALLPLETPANDSRFMVIPHYGTNCTVVLSNPSLVINAGSRDEIRYRTCPVLFSAGFTPGGHILSKPSRSLVEGSPGLNSIWKDVRQYGTAASMATPTIIPTQTGSIGIYLPDNRYRYGIQDDHCPVIIWKWKDRRLAYVGDAAADIAGAILASVSPVNVLIVGRHSRDPFDQYEDIIATGAGLVIFTCIPEQGLAERLAQEAEVHVAPGNAPKIFNLADY